VAGDASGQTVSGEKGEKTWGGEDVLYDLSSEGNQMKNN